MDDATPDTFKVGDMENNTQLYADPIPMSAVPGKPLRSNMSDNQGTLDAVHALMSSLLQTEMSTSVVLKQIALEIRHLVNVEKAYVYLIDTSNDVPEITLAAQADTQDEISPRMRFSLQHEVVSSRDLLKTLQNRAQERANSPKKTKGSEFTGPMIHRSSQEHGLPKIILPDTNEYKVLEHVASTGVNLNVRAEDTKDQDGKPPFHLVCRDFLVTPVFSASTESFSRLSGRDRKAKALIQVCDKKKWNFH